LKYHFIHLSDVTSAVATANDNIGVKGGVTRIVHVTGTDLDERSVFPVKCIATTDQSGDSTAHRWKFPSEEVTSDCQKQGQGAH
jgi:hypothetical protein